MRKSVLIKSLSNSVVLFFVLSRFCSAATVIQQQAGSTSLAASLTRYQHMTGNASPNADTTEGWVNSIYRSGGTLSNMGIVVVTNDRGASTFRTRKGTANANLVVSIDASGTGKFEDILNTDTVTAGDNWHASIVTGAGGDGIYL